MRDLNALVDEKCRRGGRVFFDARAIRSTHDGTTRIVSRHCAGACVCSCGPDRVNMAELKN
jgi:hypothetical protein